MRKLIMLATACSGLMMCGSAMAAEFQPVGALGIGGAGVARTYDAYAPYWNPAGLAFNSHTFSSRVNAGVGVQISSTMAQNVDRIGKLDVNELRDLNITNPANTANNLKLVAKAAEFVGVLNDLNHNKGTLDANADAVLGFQYSHFAMGGFSTMELGALPVTETSNVAFGGVANAGALATAIGAGSATQPATPFFTASQRADITTAFGGNVGITNAFDTQYSTTAPKTGQSNEQLKDALVHMGQALTSGAGSLENNTSTLEYRGLALVELPFSYGHPIDLGNMGKLGVGATAKVMWGRAFVGESQIVKVKDSGDIVKNITDTYKDSTTFGIDLGALWRYKEWINVGIVAKNLNSPKFESPKPLLSGDIKVKPMIRTGVSLDPLSWLTIAADLDLTENETIILDQKSRNIGGGFELHPLTWFKLRGGIYKNLAESEISAVPTFGLTIGTKWVNFDIDGAMALDKGRFKDTDYPKEARVQFNLNVLF